MKIYAEYHSHTNYSDGKYSMEDMIKEAIKYGLTEYGISDHGYMHKFFGVKYLDYPKMRDEIDKLQEKYPNIKLLLGVEANVLDDKGNIDVDDYILNYVDYVLAGYHFGSNVRSLRGAINHINNYTKLFKKNEIEYNTNALINAMKQNDIFILTHPGDKGDIDIEEVVKVAEKTNTVLEINARHNKLSVEQLLIAKKYDVKFSLGSDAHKIEHIQLLEKSLERAKNADIDIKKIINIKG